MRVFVQCDEPGSATVPASYALHYFLNPPGGPAARMQATRLAVEAIFAVLTESQQDRVLEALGWQRVRQEPGTEPTAAVHDPEPPAERWQDKAAAWLRAKADEQDARNKQHPRHAEVYPSWRARVEAWRELATEVEREP